MKCNDAVLSSRAASSWQLWPDIRFNYVEDIPDHAMCNNTCSSRSQSPWCGAALFRHKCNVITHLRKRLREINRRRVRPRLLLFQWENWKLFFFRYGDQGCGCINMLSARIHFAVEFSDGTHVLQGWTLEKTRGVPAITFRIEREFYFLTQHVSWSPWRISTEFRVVLSRPNLFFS